MFDYSSRTLERVVKYSKIMILSTLFLEQSQVGQLVFNSSFIINAINNTYFEMMSSL